MFRHIFVLWRSSIFFRCSSIKLELPCSSYNPITSYLPTKWNPERFLDSLWPPLQFWTKISRLFPRFTMEKSPSGKKLSHFKVSGTYCTCSTDLDFGVKPQTKIPSFTYKSRKKYSCPFWVSMPTIYHVQKLFCTNQLHLCPKNTRMSFFSPDASCSMCVHHFTSTTSRCTMVLSSNKRPFCQS